MPACITPAIARGITNYMPHCELNAQLKEAMQVHTDSEYRKQLQQTPQRFDAIAKELTPFSPYWPVSPCPKLTE